jgi:hypothetical protein
MLTQSQHIAIPDKDFRVLRSGCIRRARGEMMDPPLGSAKPVPGLSFNFQPEAHIGAFLRLVFDWDQKAF